jgi:hypothetical protein
MPRTASEDVFQLVHSLKKAEKRYFRQYAGMGNGGRDLTYVRMFDLMDAQKKYKENVIVRKLGIRSPSRFANQKKYLGELILESLRWYHSRHSVDAQLWAAITSIEVLYEKRLLRQCMKLLQKAKAKAIHYDKQRHLLELYTWEEKLMIEMLSSERSEEVIDTIFKGNKEASERVQHVIRFRQLLNNTVRLFRKGGLIRSAEHQKALRRIASDPLLKNEKDYATYHELYYFFNIKGMISMLMSDWGTSYTWRKKHLELIESHPEQIQESPRLYISSLNNFILSCEYTQRTAELDLTFAKVLKLMADPVYNANTNIMLRLLGCCSSVLHHYILTGEFEKGAGLLRQMEGPFYRVLPVEINKSSEISFYYTFAYACFGAGELKRALYWLNKILNDPDTGVRDDIRVAARLLNLIVHYELGNENLLEYNVRSTYRFLYNRNSLFRMETIVINFIRLEMPKINSRREELQAFARLKKEIEKLARDPNQKRSLEYFDFISWLESRISGKEFAEVVKEKTKK